MVLAAVKADMAPIGVAMEQVTEREQWAFLEEEAKAPQQESLVKLLVHYTLEGEVVQEVI